MSFFGARSIVRATVLAIVLACLWLALAGCKSRTGPQKLTVAAAADLNFALEPISRNFRAAHPEVTLEVAYGSSGNYYTQIRNHAPFDLFLSADVDYPRKLAAEGIGVADSIFIYAVGRIVVWVPAGSPFDPAKLLRQASAGDSSIRHLAIANPEHAPYGRAAAAALHSLGAYDGVKKKLVLGENIAQTLQFVETGAADAGIVALSLALAPPMRTKGRYWEIPLTAYPKIEQGGTIVKPSPAASGFRSFLMAAASRRILKEYGFLSAEE